MTKTGIKILTVILLALTSFKSSAQFSLTGNDPAALRWRQMETENFRLIFPKGEDSLARVYGTELEVARLRIARSSGYLIGQSYKGKMPVVLHSRYVLPNASVTWAPKRMDIFTVNDPYEPTAMPWVRNLAIHEGRHAAQMQFGADRGNKALHWLFGEMAAGAFAGIYPGPAFLEGDAVVAETALSRSGRGRQASFLEYMRPAFDCGDRRDYYRWFYGSNKNYTPDYYRVGYMLIAGTRVFFNDPLFTQEYFDRVVRKGWLFNLQKTVKAASGKSFNESFRIIEENFQQLWNVETALREPFMPSRQVSRTPSMHTEYKGAVTVDGSGIYSLKSGMATANSLVRLDASGNEKRIRSFASYTSSLFLDSESQRIFWSESVAGCRWTLGGSSRIRYVDLTKPRKVHDLTKKEGISIRHRHLTEMSSPPLNILTREDRGSFCWTPLMDPSRNRSSLRTRFSSRSRPGSETGFLRQDCRRTEWESMRLSDGWPTARLLSVNYLALNPSPSHIFAPFRLLDLRFDRTYRTSECPAKKKPSTQVTLTGSVTGRRAISPAMLGSRNKTGRRACRSARFLKEHNCLFYATGLE